MRLPVLDLLRFLAAFAVMSMHILLRGFPQDSFYHYSFGDLGSFVRWNYLAVNLFFIISGYVIFLSCQHGQLKRFIESRFLRLYPAYWVCCSFSFLFAYFFLQEINHVNFSRYIANMTMFNGFIGVGYIDGVFWTLTLELKFYILTGLLLFFNKLKSVEKYLWIWLLISAVNYYAQLEILNFIFITEYSAFFIVGACFFLFQKNGWSLPRMSLLLWAVILGFLSELYHLEMRSEHYGLDYDSLSLALIMLFIILIFYISIHVKNLPILVSNFLEKLGKASYPLYLIHLNLSLAMLNIFAGNGQYRYELAYLLILINPVLAYLTAIYIEQPLANFLKDILKRP